MRQTASIQVLLVSDARDESLREGVGQLRAAGATVEIVADVYAAMARLAKGDRFTAVLVDVRTLDRHESGFLQLAPRYFDDVALEIPWLDGTTRAVVRLGQPDLKTTEIAALAESIRARTSRIESYEPPAEPPAEPAAEASPPTALSTNGAAETHPDEPSLHEAVRMRMTETAAEAPVRRRPPTRMPPAAQIPPAENRNLTSEEVEALFDASDLEDGNGGQPK